MSFIVAYVHCYGYIYSVLNPFAKYPATAIITSAALGLFTFVSGYLLGRKYTFSNKAEVLLFFRKRVLRIFPLFLLASVGCWLIGFNSARATFNGIVCISPFVKPRPLTLWYIPVIVLCYLITPFYNRGSIKRKVIIGIAIVAVLSLLTAYFKSIDQRLVFNVFFYLLGMCTSSRFDWRLDGKWTWVKYFVVFSFLFLLILGQCYQVSDIYRNIVGAIGVIALLFVCGWIEKLIIRQKTQQEEGPSVSSSILNQKGILITKLSYCSFAAYLFHRLFFWAGEQLWNPSVHWIKWVYMLGVVFPLICIASYFIQKGYDTLVNKIELRLHTASHSK